MTATRVTKGDFIAKLGEVLLEADKSFGETGDVMEALGWVALAAKSGAPLPPGIGEWLHTALSEYQNSDVTMDEAMGLSSRGKPPRRKSREARDKQAALGRMWMLCSAGAERKDAAVLVASVTGRAVEQLVRAYGESSFPARESQPFDGMAPHEVAAFVRITLTDYPDGPETEQEKAAIMRSVAA